MVRAFFNKLLAQLGITCSKRRAACSLVQKSTIGIYLLQAQLASLLLRFELGALLKASGLRLLFI